MTLPPYLAAEVTTLCHCWRVTLADGTVMGFTDHDRPLVVAGTTFAPETGLSASEARASMGMAIDASEVEGALSSVDISEADILAGRYDGAEVDTLLVDWTEPVSHHLIRRAAIARIVRSDGRLVAQMEGHGRRLDLVHGRLLRRHCDAELGDARCGVATGSYTASGEVVAVEGNDRLIVTGLSGHPQGWFAYGMLSWSGGPLAGRTERVVDFRHDAAGDVLVIWPQAGAMPEPGAAFSVVAGCDKQFSTCKAKFANPANFRGFPHLPGNDSAYSYVSTDGAFDGAALVP